MKCGSCGAIGSVANINCQFCGNQLAKIKPNTDNKLTKEVGKEKIGALSSYVQDSMNMVQDLGKTPSSQFNILAFLFPVSYLWGYGARDNAKSIATVIIAPQIIIWVVSIFVTSLATLLVVGQFIWTIYVHFMVSTRLEALTSRDKEYAFVEGILVTVAYLVILNVFSVSYLWN
jgi:hypothetical protein